MLKDYYACRAWLEGFIPYTYSKKNLGLERITHLLRLLGNPEREFRSILVAGTSGKGSCAYYLARALREAQISSQFTLPSSGQAVHSLRKLIAGENLSDNRQPITDNLKVGLHISPHLTYIGERMQTFRRVKESENQRDERMGGPIPVKRLVRLINEIKPVVEEIKSKQPELTPSYFEILVAASFLYFAQEKVDIAVVEVGLGGRLDATNVLQPLVSLITNIGLDHTEILGNTIEEIAREKAGIIKSISNFKFQISNDKKGVPVVTGASGKALAVIKNVAKSKKSSLKTINTLKKSDRLYFDLLRNIKDKIDSDFGTKVYVTDECFFLVNLALKALGIKLSVNEQKKVFSARFAARFEEIDDGILVDGAHNRDKVRALINWVQKKSQRDKESKRQSKIILVCGFKKGKDWKGILRLLLKELDIERICATQFVTPTDTGFFAAVQPEEIAKYIKSIVNRRSTIVKTFKNSQEAVWGAVRERDKGVKRYKGNKSVILNTSLTLSVNSVKDLKLRDSSLKRAQNDNMLVLVTGSLYLAGEARTIWHLPPY